MDRHIMTAGELLRLLRMVDPNAPLVIHYVGNNGMEDVFTVTDVVAAYVGQDTGSEVSLLTWPVWNSPWEPTVTGDKPVEVSQRYWPSTTA